LGFLLGFLCNGEREMGRGIPFPIPKELPVEEAVTLYKHSLGGLQQNEPSVSSLA